MDELGMRLMIREKAADPCRSVVAAITHSDRAAPKLFSLIRQGMRLQIVYHLKLVLDVPEK